MIVTVTERLDLGPKVSVFVLCTQNIPRTCPLAYRQENCSFLERATCTLQAKSIALLFYFLILTANGPVKNIYLNLVAPILISTQLSQFCSLAVALGSLLEFQTPSLPPPPS